MQKNASVSPELISKLLEANNGIGIISGLYDQKLSICFFTDLMASLLGYTHEEFARLSGQGYLSLVCLEDRELFLTNRSRIRYYHLMDREGREVFVKEQRANVQTGNGDVQWVASVRKMDNIAAEELLMKMHLATEYDSFTGFLNKNAFFDKVDFLLKNNTGRPYTMIIIDLDDLKEINDVCGHTAGDKAILTICRHLKRSFRSDDLIGRFGGDEFVIFVMDTNSRSLVEDRFNKIIGSLANDIFFKELERHCGISAGAYCSSDSVLTREEIFDRADAALYKAKLQGKGRLMLY